MIETLMHAAVEVAANDPDREWAVQRPNRGMTGAFQDSNVPTVWRGVPDRVRAVWLCIRRHEAMAYDRENPVSSASGAGQWIRSTWVGLAHWVKVDGAFVARQYPEAKDAPAWIQDAAFLHVYKHDGLRMWNGTGCPGTGS